MINYLTDVLLSFTPIQAAKIIKLYELLTYFLENFINPSQLSPSFTILWLAFTLYFFSSANLFGYSNLSRGRRIARIISTPPNMMNGTLSICPMLSVICASNATWSFFTNSIMNRHANSTVKNTPNISPGRSSALRFQYIHISNPNKAK